MAFGWDKSQSRGLGLRVREKALLGLSFMGGWPAAKVAQAAFRHKTHKQPFGEQLNGIVCLHVVLTLIVVGAVLGGVTGDNVLDMLAMLAGETRDERPQMPRRFGPGT